MTPSERKSIFQPTLSDVVFSFSASLPMFDCISDRFLKPKPKPEPEPKPRVLHFRYPFDPTSNDMYTACGMPIPPPKPGQGGPTGLPADASHFVASIEDMRPSGRLQTSIAQDGSQYPRYQAPEDAAPLPETASTAVAPFPQTGTVPTTDSGPSQEAEPQPRPPSAAAGARLNSTRLPFFDDRKVSWFEGKSRTTSFLRYCADQVRIYSYATHSRLSRPADMSSKVALAVFMCTRVRNSHGGKLYMHSRRMVWRLLNVPEISYSERRQSPLAGQLCRVVLYKGGIMSEEERRLRFQNISQRVLGAKEEAYIMSMAYEQRFIAICQALEVRQESH